MPKPRTNIIKHSIHTPTDMLNKIKNFIVVTIVLLLVGFTLFGHRIAPVKAAEMPDCTALHIMDQEQLETCKLVVDAQITSRGKEYDELQERQDILSAANDTDRIRIRSINRRLSDFQSAQ